MPDDKNASGDIESRIVELEELFRAGKHERAFREFAGYAKEFARPTKRAEAMAKCGEFSDLLNREHDFSAEEFAGRREKYAIQAMVIAFKIAEDPRDLEPQSEAA